MMLKDNQHVRHTQASEACHFISNLLSITWVTMITCPLLCNCQTGRPTGQVLPTVVPPPNQTRSSMELTCIQGKYCSAESEKSELERLGYPIAKHTDPFCSCERNCNDYGECCVDKHNYDKTSRPIAPHLLECVRVYHGPCSGDLDDSYLMITHCPVEYGNELLRNLCEESNAGTEGGDSLVLPATSRATSRTYGNIYCAACNGEAIGDLASWEFQSTCDGGAGNSIHVECEIQQVSLKELAIAEVGILCEQHYNFIRTCPGSYAGPSLNNCTYGPALYTFTDTQVFKNGDCALCNGVTDSYCKEQGFKSAVCGESPTAFSILVRASGECLSADKSPIPCPVRQPGFCSKSQYYSRTDKECKSLCQSDEHYTDFGRCEKVDCIIQSYEEFRPGQNTDYNGGFLRNKINDTFQYCFKCAVIPIQLAPSEPDGFTNRDSQTGEAVSTCSPSFVELEQHQLIRVNSTKVILHSNADGTMHALNRAAVLDVNGTSFLNLSAPEGGIRCQFKHVPVEAIADSSEEKVTINENLGLSAYRLPYYVNNTDGSYEICFENLKPRKVTDCQYRVSSSVRNVTNGIAYVEEISESYRLYDENHFQLNDPNGEIFICERAEKTWLDEYEAKINLVCYILSIGGLIVTVLVYSWVKSLRNVPGTIIINESIAFIAAYVCFAFIETADGSGQACLVVAILTHFFFLAAFIFAVIYAFVLVQGILATNPNNAKGTRRKIFVTISGWLVSALLIGIFCGIHVYAPEYGPMYAHPSCFVNNSFVSLRNYFYIPLILMIGINSLALGLIICKLVVSFLRMRNLKADKKDKSEVTRVLIIAFKLEVSFGLLWVIAVAALFTQNIVIVSIFTIVNSLQGFFLFLIFVCNARVLGKVKAYASTTGTFSTALKSKLHTARGDKNSVEMSLTGTTAK